MNDILTTSIAASPNLPLPPRGNISECLAGIRRGDPAAAHSLYDSYGASMRQYFENHGAVRDVQSAVFATLVQVVRSVRELDIQDPDELTQTVRHLCANRVFEARKLETASAMTLDRRGQVVNRLFTALNCTEREVLLRSCVLLQADTEISREIRSSLGEVRRTQAKARVLYRLCCDDKSNPAPPLLV